MEDLDKLLEDYSKAYLQYPEPRRKIEMKLMTAVVAAIHELKARRPVGRPPKVEEAA